MDLCHGVGTGWLYLSARVHGTTGGVFFFFLFWEAGESSLSLPKLVASSLNVRALGWAGVQAFSH